MTNIVSLIYNRKIEIERKDNIHEDMNIKPYLDAANIIADKYGLKRVCIAFKEIGFWKPKNVLCNIQYNTEEVDNACGFVKEALSTTIGKEKLADRAEIYPLSTG
jgi:hypothetical protein